MQKHSEPSRNSAIKEKIGQILGLLLLVAYLFMLEFNPIILDRLVGSYRFNLSLGYKIPNYLIDISATFILMLVLLIPGLFYLFNKSIWLKTKLIVGIALIISGSTTFMYVHSNTHVANEAFLTDHTKRILHEREKCYASSGICGPNIDYLDTRALMNYADYKLKIPSITKVIETDSLHASKKIYLGKIHNLSNKDLIIFISKEIIDEKDIHLSTIYSRKLISDNFISINLSDNEAAEIQLSHGKYCLAIFESNGSVFYRQKCSFSGSLIWPTTSFFVNEGKFLHPKFYENGKIYSSNLLYLMYVPSSTWRLQILG